jgi:uncharacterized protein
MKFWFSLILLLVAGSSFALDLPSYSSRVNDFSNTLTLTQLKDLDYKATNIKGAEVGVVVITTLDGEDIEDFSNKLFKKWGVGEKDKNNGTLLVVAMKDHKLRIEIGYGLEGSIPDIVANHIINDNIKPFLKKNDLAGAINAYLDAVQSSIDNPEVTKKEATSEGSVSWGFWLIIILLGIVVIFFIIAVIDGGSGGEGGGGFFGSGSSSSGSSGSSFGGGDSGGGGASGSW